MNTEILASAIVGHLIGDYLLQNDWMALSKKKRTWNCIVHCAIWMNCVTLFMWLGGWNGAWPTTQIVGLILFWSHFLQDRTDVISKYMDLIGQNKFRTGPCAPWSVIVVDNVWHILTIWIVWRFVI